MLVRFMIILNLIEIRNALMHLNDIFCWLYSLLLHLLNNFNIEDFQRYLMLSCFDCGNTRVLINILIFNCLLTSSPIRSCIIQVTVARTGQSSVVLVEKDFNLVVVLFL